MNPKVQHITIDDNHAGQRIDNFLMTLFKRQVPKSVIYRKLRKGEVRVNKGRIAPSYKLQLDDVVRVPPVQMADSETAEAEKQAHDQQRATTDWAEQLKDAVLYEDDSVIVINKPSGLAVHGGTGVNVGMIEILRQQRPELKFLELAHRLDRETSGCILIAKSRKALLNLHEQFREKTTAQQKAISTAFQSLGRRASVESTGMDSLVPEDEAMRTQQRQAKKGEGYIKKTYHAIVIGHWPKHLNKITAPLKKNTLKSGERIVQVDRAEGKSSTTTFQILQKGKALTLVAAYPQTGRTHQIRVHAQHAGCPILGDEKYASRDRNRDLMKQYGIKRLCLHAYELQFTSPASGEVVKVQAEYDQSFQQLVNQLS